MREQQAYEVARYVYIERRKMRGTDGFRPPVQPKTATAHGGPSYSPDAGAAELLAIAGLFDE